MDKKKARKKSETTGRSVSSKKVSAETDVKVLRKEIDLTDDKILVLLNQRAELVKKIGRIKSQSAQGIYLPGREEKIFDRLQSINQGPFPTSSIKAVFREIISACRSLQKPLTVSFLGPEATFTHLASRQQFGHSASYRPQPSISDVFQEVEKGKSDYGVVPVENSTEGVVSHTLDMFMDSELKICAEVVLEIKHNLLSRSGNINDIKRIYSHPQPLAQCRHWLRKHAGGIPLAEVASTAEAARRASRDKTAGAVASAYAADVYQLKVVAKGIEDMVNNFTRFLVIGHNLGPRSGRDITSVMFSVKDRPGILYQALGIFSKRGINLSKIESRPLKGKAWEYVFFIEMDGHIEDELIQEAIHELEKHSVFVKVLGSFPKMRKEYQLLGV
jgi:chorismate mutase/prephenate dehydratase